MYSELVDENEESVSRNALNNSLRRVSDAKYISLEEETHNNIVNNKKKKKRNIQIALFMLLFIGGAFSLYWFHFRDVHKTQADRDNEAATNLYGTLKNNIKADNSITLNKNTLSNVNITKNMNVLLQTDNIVLNQANINLIQPSSETNNRIIVETSGKTSIYGHQSNAVFKFHYFNNTLYSYMIAEIDADKTNVKDMLPDGELDSYFQYVSIKKPQYHLQTTAESVLEDNNNNNENSSENDDISKKNNLKLVASLDKTNSNSNEIAALMVANGFSSSTSIVEQSKQQSLSKIDGIVIKSDDNVDISLDFSVYGTLKPKVDLSIGLKNTTLKLGKYLKFTNLTIGVTPKDKAANISAILHIMPPNVEELDLYMFGSVSLSTKIGKCNITQLGKWTIPGKIPDLKLQDASGVLSLQFTDTSDSTHVSVKEGYVSAGLEFGNLTTILQFALPPPVDEQHGNESVPFAFEVIFDDTIINTKQFPKIGNKFPATEFLKSAWIFSPVDGMYHFIHADEAPVKSIAVKQGFNFVGDVHINHSISVNTLLDKYSDAVLLFNGDIFDHSGQFGFDLHASLNNYVFSDIVTLNNLSVDLHYPAVQLFNVDTYVNVITNLTVDLPHKDWEFKPLVFGAQGLVGPNIVKFETHLNTELRWNISIGSQMFEIKKLFLTYTRETSKCSTSQNNDNKNLLKSLIIEKSLNSEEEECKKEKWSGSVGGVYDWDDQDVLVQLEFPYTKDQKSCVDLELLQLKDITFHKLLENFVPSLKDNQNFEAPNGVMAAIFNTSIENVRFFFSPTCGNITLTGTIDTTLFGKAYFGLVLFKNESKDAHDHWHFSAYIQPDKDWKITDTSLVGSGFPEIALFGCTFVLSSSENWVTIPINNDKMNANITIDAKKGLNLHAFIDISKSSASFVDAFHHMFPKDTEIEVAGYFSNNGWSLASGLLGNENIDLGHHVILEKAFINISHNSNISEFEIVGRISVQNPLDSKDRIAFNVNATLANGFADFVGDAEDDNATIAINLGIKELKLEYLKLGVHVNWPTNNTDGQATAVNGTIDGALLFDGDSEIIVSLDLMSTGVVQFNGSIVDDPPLTLGHLVEKICGNSIWDKLSLPSSLKDDIENSWAFNSGNVILRTAKPLSINGSTSMDLFNKAELDAVIRVFESQNQISKNEMEFVLGVEIGVGNFSTIMPDIKCLDKYPMTGLAVAVATTADEIKFPDLPVPYSVLPGFNFLAALAFNNSGIVPLQKIYDWTGVEEAVVYGVVNTDQFVLHAGIQGDSKVWVFHLRAAGLILKVNTQVMVGVELEIQVDLSHRDQDHLLFYGNMMAGDEGFSVDAAMKKDWTDPFGVKGVVLKSCEVTIELSWDIIPVAAGIGGGIFIDGIGGSVDIYIDQQTVLLAATFGRFNLQNIVDGILGAVGVTKPPNIVQILSDFKLDGAQFFVNDATGPVTFNGQTYPVGVYFAIQGLELFEVIKGNASILINTDTLDLAGSLAPINLLDGKLVFSGARGPDTPANLSLHIGSSSLSSLEFSGGITIFSEHVAAAMTLQDHKWAIFVNMSLFDELFNFTLDAYCETSVAAPVDFYLDFVLNNEVLDYIADEVPRRLNESYQTESAQVKEWEDDVDRHLANLTSIQKRIDDLKAADEAKLDPLVKRLHDAETDLERKKSQVDSLQSQIDHYKKKIKDLKWYEKWKAVGYASAIAALEVAKGTADLALDAAEEVVKLAREAVEHAQEVDPRVLALEAEYGIEHAAWEAAKTILEKGQEVYSDILKLIEKWAVWQSKIFNIEHVDIHGSFNDVLSGDLASMHLVGTFFDHNVDIHVDIDVHLLESMVSGVWAGILDLLHINTKSANEALAVQQGLPTPDEMLAIKLLLL